MDNIYCPPRKRHPGTVLFWVIMAASVLVFGGNMIRFAAG